MTSRRSRLLKKLNLNQPEFNYKPEIIKEFRKESKRQLEELKVENLETKKRTKLANLNELEDELIKKRLADIALKEEKKGKTECKRKHVNKKKLELILKDLKKSKVLLHDDGCNKFEAKDVIWSSPTYIIRQIRNSILNHDWSILTHLLLLLLNHNPSYFSYVKEISFLNFLVNGADYNSELLEEFLQKCFVNVSQAYVKHSLDVCYLSNSIK